MPIKITVTIKGDDAFGNPSSAKKEFLSYTSLLLDKDRTELDEYINQVKGEFSGIIERVTVRCSMIFV